ncbi:TonB-dependent receptor [Haliscomenobacter hydrossis]|uniref:TonB-dependent receptor plug n=1 Tax=Haliscomenobacter hydrossis (strain ATCC 27775 / DSM 1100 / LMG 10767 / O) TaxID=760192 RepID=F4L143_HALH1|nr:Plug domain-containing protein [Haliscomenobacter hydrossis]AEE51630.1 TonB-dependent receptor plug [Haliscomenobacter hydrossis DSM 1100]
MKDSTYRPSCVLLIFPLSWLLWPPGLAERLQQQLKNYQTKYPAEKVYLHTDKPHYALGENLWFSAYLTAGPEHLPSLLSNPVYVELIGPDQHKASRYIGIQDGVGTGDFDTERDWPEGKYLLRAYTNYMRNFDSTFFFQRELVFFKPKLEADKPADPLVPISDFSVQFMPEGGDLVQGLSSQIGVKATSNLGTGVQFEGKIIDDQGTPVAVFKTYRFGLGAFSFTPQTGRRYNAEINHQGIVKNIPLPTALPQGYTLQVTQRPPNQLLINVRCNVPNGLKDAVILGHLRGQSIFTFSNTEGQDKLSLTIPTDSIPEGIAQFTLFSNTGEPLCERLVFVDNPRERARLSISTDNPLYNKRQKVKVELQLKDQEGKPLQAIVSATVTDKQSVYWAKYGQDIRSYLLLQSDLPGNIEDPGYFFVEENATRRQLLDMLMLTQGWRRFSWKAVLRDTLPDLAWLPEQGFTISGQTTKLDQPDKPVAADLMVVAVEKGISERVSSGPDGRFAITGFPFIDSTRVVIQAAKVPNNTKKGKNADSNQQQIAGNRDLKIRLDGDNPPPVNPLQGFTLPLSADPVQQNSFLADSKKLADLDSLFPGIWKLSLAEFEVKAKREKNPYGVGDIPYRAPTDRMIIDSVPGKNTALSVFDLLRRIPGAQVVGTFPNQSVVLRGINSLSGAAQALFVLDGTVVDASTLSTVPVSTIAFVDVLKGGQAAMFGSRGINGVVSVYTKRNGSQPVQYDVNGIINFKHPGFYKAREFYAPLYDQKKPEHDRPDYRTTLHWQPLIETDKNGRATFSFFTSDKGGAFEVLVEGMTLRGSVVSGRY